MVAEEAYFSRHGDAKRSIKLPQPPPSLSKLQDKKHMTIKRFVHTDPSLGIPTAAKAPPKKNAAGAADGDGDAAASAADSARKERAEKIEQGGTGGGQGVTGVKQKVLYTATHTAWKGTFQILNDGTYTRVGKDGGRWWSENWDGQSASLVLAWTKWPKERLSTKDGGRTFTCAGLTKWKDQEEPYKFELKLPTKVKRVPNWIKTMVEPIYSDSSDSDSSDSDSDDDVRCVFSVHFSVISNRKIEKLPRVSCILLRNAGKMISARRCWPAMGSRCSTC